MEIKETEASGHNTYGKYRRYPPHAEIVEKVPDFRVVFTLLICEVPVTFVLLFVIAV